MLAGGAGNGKIGGGSVAVESSGVPPKHFRLTKGRSFISDQRTNSVNRMFSMSTMAYRTNEVEHQYWSTKIGANVIVSGVKPGVLKFFGKTLFAEGYWCGIELDEPLGKHNGVVEGITYFSCRELHGIFAPPSKVELHYVEESKDCSNLDDATAFEEHDKNQGKQLSNIPRLFGPKAIYKKYDMGQSNFGNNTTETVSLDVGYGKPTSRKLLQPKFKKGSGIPSFTSGNSVASTTSDMSIGKHIPESNLLESMFRVGKENSNKQKCSVDNKVTGIPSLNTFPTASHSSIGSQDKLLTAETSHSDNVDTEANELGSKRKINFEFNRKIANQIPVLPQKRNFGISQLPLFQKTGNIKASNAPEELLENFESKTFQVSTCKQQTNEQQTNEILLENNNCDSKIPRSDFSEQFDKSPHFHQNIRVESPLKEHCNVNETFAVSPLNEKCTGNTTFDISPLNENYNVNKTFNVSNEHCNESEAHNKFASQSDKHELTVNVTTGRSSNESYDIPEEKPEDLSINLRTKMCPISARGVKANTIYSAKFLPGKERVSLSHCFNTTFSKDSVNEIKEIARNNETFSPTEDSTETQAPLEKIPRLSKQQEEALYVQGQLQSMREMCSVPDVIPQAECDADEECEGYGRQGSFDMDESLGILTPSQMKDFTFLAEGTLAKTPSIEDILEINDEIVDRVLLKDVDSQGKETSIDSSADFMLRENERFPIQTTSTPSTEKTFKQKDIINESVPTLENSHFHITFNENSLGLKRRSDGLTDLSSVSSVDYEGEAHNMATFLHSKCDIETQELETQEGNVVSESMDKEKAARSAVNDKKEANEILNHANLSLKPVLHLSSENLKDEPFSSLTDSFLVNEVKKILSKTQKPDEFLKTSNSPSNQSSSILHFLSNSNRQLSPLAEEKTKDISVDSSKSQSVMEIVATCSTVEPVINYLKDQVMTEYLIQHMGPNFSDHIAEKKERPASALTMSVTSIDTGYQGDAECDVHSERGTTSATNTPIEEHKRAFATDEKDLLSHQDMQLSLRSQKTDIGSDSDFCSDMGTSWTESELENDEKGKGRSARVIDGTLYFGKEDDKHLSINKETLSEMLLIEPKTEGDQKFDDVDSGAPSEIFMEEKATINEDEIKGIADIKQLELEDKNNTGEDTETDKSNGSEATILDAQLDGDKTMQDTAIPERIDKADLKLPISSIDEENTPSVSTSKTTTGSCKTQSPGSTVDSKTPMESPTSPGTEKAKTPNRSLSSKKSPQMATNKAETPDRLKRTPRKEDDTPKKFKMPKKNVMSKIKAMIEATSSKLTHKDEPADEPKKSSRTPKKSRWEAVMSKIAASQAEDKVKAKTKKEVKSKVDTNLLAAKSPPKNETVLKSVPERRMRTSRKISTQSSKSSRLDSTVSSDPLSISGDPAEGDVSIHSSIRSSHSDLSTSQPSSRVLSKSKVPRVTGNGGHKLDRPCSPSQMSDVSTASAASHLSAFSHTSHMSRTSSQLLQKSNSSLSSSASSATTSGVAKTNRDVSSRPTTALPSSAVQQNNRRNIYLNSANRSHAANAVAGANTKKAQSPTSRTTISKASSSQRVPKPSLPPRANTTVPKVTPRVQPKEQNRIRNIKPSAGLVKSGHHQPDLLNSSAVAATRAEAAREITRLEALCEARTKESIQLKMQLTQRTLGFEALTTVVKYMTEELDAFATPQLLENLERTQGELSSVKASLDESLKERQNLESNLQSLLKAQEEEIEKIKKDHEQELDECRIALNEAHEEEIERLKEDHFLQIEALKKEQALELSECVEKQTRFNEDVERKHDLQLEEMKKQQQLELENVIRNHNETIATMKVDYESVENTLQEKVASLQLRCHDLQLQKKEYEDVILKDSDHKIQVTAAKVSELEKEVDSLKTVLEMRSQEIHDLRRENNELKKSVEELDLAREEIKKLKAKNEDLQALMDIKNQNERQLSSEQQMLREWYEKESKVNERLSMEKEELQWKLQQSMEGSMLAALFGGTPDLSLRRSYSATNASPYLSSTPNGIEEDMSSRRPRSSHSLCTSSPINSRMSSVRAFLSSPVVERRRRRNCSSVSEEHPDDKVDSIIQQRQEAHSWSEGARFDEHIHKINNLTLENSSRMTVTPSSGSETVKLEATESSIEGTNYTPTGIDLESKLTETSVATTKVIQQSNKIENNDRNIKSDYYSPPHTPRKSLLERRHSVTPDTRVPSMIIVQHEDKSPQFSSRPSSARRERRESSSKDDKKPTPEAHLVNHVRKGSLGRLPFKPDETLMKSFIKNAGHKSELGNKFDKTEKCKVVLRRDSSSPLKQSMNDQLRKVHASTSVIEIDNDIKLLNGSSSLDDSLTGECCIKTNEGFMESGEGENDLKSVGENESASEESSTLHVESTSSSENLLEKKLDLTETECLKEYQNETVSDFDFYENTLSNGEMHSEKTESEEHHLEDTVSESHNSSDFEIISESEDTRSLEAACSDWSNPCHIPASSQNSQSKTEDKSADITRVTKTTLVITFKTEDKLYESSCGSSPPPEPMDMESSSSSDESSPRASPIFQNPEQPLIDDSSCSYTMSPRTAAGEAMILEDLHQSNRPEPVNSDTSGILLRRTFHDQHMQDSGSSCSSSVRVSESYSKDSSSEDTSQICISKPATPESSSQAIAPTDSTNIDLSWSDDDIPSESEV